MDIKGKEKLFTINDKLLVQADAHTGTHIELASHLRLSESMLNTIVKNCEEIVSKVC
jgi:hypothetical protein